MASAQQKAEFVRLQEQNVPKIISLAKETAGWDVLEADDDGVNIASKDVDGKTPIIRGIGSVKAPPVVVLDYLWPVDKRSQWDEYAEKKKNKLIEKLDGQSDVISFALPVPGPFSDDRDFCVYRCHVNQKDGSIVVVLISVTHPRCPADKSYARGTVDFGGFVITPTGKQKSSLVYMLQVDMAGMVPAMVLQMINKKQALCVAGIRKLVESNYTPPPPDPALELAENRKKIADSLKRIQGIVGEAAGPPWEDNAGLLGAVGGLAGGLASTVASSVGVEEGAGPAPVISTKRVSEDNPTVFIKKSTTKVNATVQQMVDKLWPVKNRAEWWLGCAETKTIQEIDKGSLEIVRVVVTPENPLADKRDYCLLRSRAHFGDGVAIVEVSIEADAVPLVEAHVRNTLTFSGFVLTSIEGGTMCQVTYVVQQGASIAPPAAAPSLGGLFGSITSAISDAAGAEPVGVADPIAICTAIAAMYPLPAPPPKSEAPPSSSSDPSTSSLPIPSALSSFMSSNNPPPQEPKPEPNVVRGGDVLPPIDDPIVLPKELIQRETKALQHLFARYDRHRRNTLDAAEMEEMLCELVILYDKDMNVEAVAETAKLVVERCGAKVSFADFSHWWGSNGKAEREADRAGIVTAFDALDDNKDQKLTSEQMGSLVGDLADKIMVDISEDIVLTQMTKVDVEYFGMINVDQFTGWWEAVVFDAIISKVESGMKAMNSANPTRDAVVDVKSAANVCSVFDVPPAVTQRQLQRLETQEREGAVKWHGVLQLIINTKSPSQAFTDKIENDMPIVDVRAEYMANFSPEEIEFLESAFELCDMRREGCFSQEQFKVAMAELGMDHSEIKWASLPLGHSGFLDWKGFVTGVGPWLLAREEQDQAEKTSNTQERENALLRKVFFLYSNGATSIAHERFQMLFYELVVVGNKATSTDDIEATTDALREAGERMTYDEFTVWWDTTRKAEKEEEALRIAELFQKMAGDSPQINEAQFGDLVVTLVSEFPCSVVPEDIILEQMNSVERRGGITLNVLSHWWQSCADDKRVMDMEMREKVFDGINPRREVRLQVESLFDLVACLVPNRHVDDQLYEEALTILDEHSSGFFDWQEFLHWARLSIPTV